MPDATQWSSSITTSGRSEFAADPAIVDKRIHIGGVEFTVIGVAPAGFTGIDHDVKPAFYIPHGDVHGGSERRAARPADAARDPQPSPSRDVCAEA